MCFQMWNILEGSDMANIWKRSEVRRMWREESAPWVYLVSLGSSGREYFRKWLEVKGWTPSRTPGQSSGAQPQTVDFSRVSGLCFVQFFFNF